MSAKCEDVSNADVELWLGRIRADRRVRMALQRTRFGSTLGAIAGGVTQHQVGRWLGIAQAAVWYQIRAGVRHLQWVVGPGSWYEGPVEAVGPLADDADRVALQTLWSTLSVTEVARKLGISHGNAWRLVRSAVQKPKWSAKRRRAFAAAIAYTEHRA